jgi:hypothetical protein
MTNDTWQMILAFFVMFVSAGAIIAYGIVLGRKESPSKAPARDKALAA